MRVTRSLTAVASAALLALGGVALAATSASAADEVLRPGAQSPTFTWGPVWQGDDSKDQFAQQFVQPEDGNLVSFSIKVSGEFEGAAIHLFDSSSGPSAEPIVGGVADSLDLGTESDGGAYWATLNFPDRPLLVEGTRYALVLDSRTPNGQNISVVMNQTPDGDTGLDPWERKNGEWVGVGTPLHSNFTSQLTTSTETPDPEIPGETPNGEEPGDGSPATKAPVKPKAVETGLAA